MTDIITAASALVVLAALAALLRHWTRNAIRRDEP